MVSVPNDTEERVGEVDTVYKFNSTESLKPGFHRISYDVDSSITRDTQLKTTFWKIYVEMWVQHTYTHTGSVIIVL